MPRHPFDILVCPDPELIKRRVAAMLAEAGGGFERAVHFGDEELSAKFWRDLASPGLLGGSRAVVLRRAEGLKAEALKALSPLVLAGDAAIWPIVCVESEWDRNAPKIPATLAKAGFWPAAEEQGCVWRHPGLSLRTLPDYVRDWAKERGLTFARGTLDDLCRLLPEDAAAVGNELAKIELVLAGRTEIGPADLELLAPAEGLDFYALVDMIQSGTPRPEVWREVLHGDADEILFRLLTNLQMDLRAVWQLAHGEGAAVRLPPWLKEKKERLARRLGEADMVRLWNLVFEAELAVKSGEKGVGQALELFVAGLHAVFAPKGRGARPAPAAGGRR